MSGIGTSGNDEIHDDGSAASYDGADGNDLLVMDLSAKTDPQYFSLWPYPPSGTAPGYKNFEHLQIVTGSGDDIGYFTDLVHDSTWGGNSWDAGAGDDLASVEMPDITGPLKSALNSSGQMVLTNRTTGDVLLILTNVERYSISGSSGNDVLASGAGNDVLAGGTGTNTLDGGAGFDTAVMDNPYSSFKMSLNADGSITLAESGEKSTLKNIEAIQFYDTLMVLGGPGNDDFVEEPGQGVSFYGGAGDDTYKGFLFQLVDGGAGNDTIIFQGLLADFLGGSHGVVNVETMVFDDGHAQMGSDTGDALTVAAGFDFLLAGKGNDTITDGRDGTAVYGGDGNDTVTVTAANVTIEGAAGTDTVYLPGNIQDYRLGNGPFPHPISFPTGPAVGLVSAQNHYFLDSVENIYIGGQRLILITDSNTTGTSGDDLFVWDGHNIVSVNGGGGSDTLAVSDSINYHYLSDQSGNDLIDGVVLTGISRIAFSDASLTLGTSGNDHFTGTDGNDGYFGGAGDDVLSGGKGDDNLQGGSGNDRLDGGAGNDTLSAGGNSGGGSNGASLSEVTGGAGDDTLIGGYEGTVIADFSAAHSTYTITFNYALNNLIVSGPDGADTLRNIHELRFADGLLLAGSAYTDDLTASSDVSFVDAGDGDDRITYTGGEAVIDGGGGTDTLGLSMALKDARLSYDPTGNFRLTSDIGSVTLIGMEKLGFAYPGPPALLGTAGADNMYDQGQAYVFIGGRGDDHMTATSSLSVALFSGAYSAYAVIRAPDGTMTVAGPDGTDSLTGFKNLQFDDYTVNFDSFGIMRAIAPDGHEYVTGTAGDDGMSGSNGAFDDLLDGGAGYDIYGASGFEGSNIVFNADGSVTVTSNSGTDILRNFEAIYFYDPTGLDLNVRLGTAGNDVATGMSGSEIEGLAGGPGDDIFNFVAGSGEVFLGGPGSDTAIFTGKMLDYIGNLQDGVIYLHENGGYGNFRLSGVEKMRFADGNGFVGDSGDNVLNGTAENDVLVGDKGNDQLNGGDGFDTALFDGNFGDYSIQISGPNATVTGPDGTDMLTAVEQLAFNGPQSGVILIGSDGNDDFGARGGLGTAAAQYQVYGGGGDDIFDPGFENDRFDGGAGIDMVVEPFEAESYTAIFNNDGSISLKSDYSRIVLKNVEKVQFSSNIAYLGTRGSDTLTGGANDDLFLPGLGNDTIDGGLGTDSVLFSGTEDQYSVVHNQDGSITVVGPDGTDTLRNVEYVVFASTLISNHSPTAHDFDGDGKGDILWQNADGTAAVWLLNGATVSGGNTVGNPGSSSWHAIGTGDFDGGGKADILWQNSDGTVAVWLMNGSTVAGGGIAGSPGSGWTVLGAADFSGDGKADILLRQSDGSLAVWLMSGATLTGGAVVGNPGSGWSFKGMGDFDGDGKTDILFQNSNGSVAVWLMNGASVAGGAVVGNPGGSWAVKAVGDFDGDGKSDILWQDASGQASIWLMNGTSAAGGGLAGSNPGTSWTVKQAADVNGDGKADILWQAADGSPAAWIMNGLSVSSGAMIGANPGAAWHVVSG